VEQREGFVATRIGINGFGRIGRQVFKAIYELHGDDLEIVAANDLGDPHTMAHLLKYDSTYGRFEGDIELSDGGIVVNGHELKLLAERDPAKLPWGDLGVDIVIESTGFFTDATKAKAHRDAGAKKVIISAPANNEDITIVLGVNDDQYDPDQHHIVSNASCTTNCLAPVAKTLHDAIGIEHGFMTTIHSYTNDQPSLDQVHKDLYRARAASLSMIPTSTGAAKAVGLVVPELAGKLDGTAIRVPTPNVSVADFKFLAKRPTSENEINNIITDAADGALKGILGYTTAPNVSADFNHNSHSSIFHVSQTKVINGTFARVLSWYDNEWGFSNRMADTAVAMGRFL
jgi:glyceraldehyde 3-phosphate dehydrogenase